ncbi:ERF family protein [Pseudomonas aeruginosa]|uniref:ERF family protein n=1 Tax=Pseudomonas aeruginosa TaxID=287 RepID=UPI00163B8677|nr:ERF family protein [Pseudomonas aeruginosa]
MLVTKSAIRPGSNFNRQGGSIFHQRQQADTSGNKNAVQAVASSVSYGKRYTAGALLNFTTHGEDDDAFTAAAPVLITEAQAKQLKSLLDKCSDKAQTAFSSIHGTPEQVTKDDFDRVLAMLKKSADQNQAG